MCKQETIDKIDKGTHIVISKNLTVLFATISPITFLIAIFYFGGYVRELEVKVNDTNTHMPYQEKIKVFVPRTEIEYKFAIIFFLYLATLQYQ